MRFHSWYLDGTWCYVVQEKMENCLLPTLEQAVRQKFMSMFLYGQDKHELITMHESVAIVGASTEFSKCMHV